MNSKFSNSRQSPSDTVKRTTRSSNSNPGFGSRPYRNSDLRFEAAGFGRLWDPGVFDRLQVPLTRYHD